MDEFIPLRDPKKFSDLLLKWAKLSDGVFGLIKGSPLLGGDVVEGAEVVQYRDPDDIAIRSISYTGDSYYYQSQEGGSRDNQPALIRSLRENIADIESGSKNYLARKYLVRKVFKDMDYTKLERYPIWAAKKTQ